MALQSRHKVDTGFNMSSLADIIFLLLIFFIVTSSFVTDAGIKVDNPTSKATEIISASIVVTIDADERYTIEVDERAIDVQRENLEQELAKHIVKGETFVKLNVDKAVATEHTVWVLGLAKSIGAKGVSIAAVEE